MKKIHFIIIVFAVLPVLLYAMQGERLVVTAPPAELNLDPFYKKYLNANGIHIISSEKVPDSAFFAAHRTIKAMTDQLPKEVLKAMTDINTRVGIMGRYEGTTDIPEHAHLAKDTVINWNLRARGLGGTLRTPLTTCAEENILCYDIDKYHSEDILVHEFAHSIHLIGIISVYPDFNKRLEEALELAKSEGKWLDTYAGSNISEYWAEGVQSWFNVNTESEYANGVHNHVNTRKDLKKYDRRLYNIISEFFEDNKVSISCHKCVNKYKKAKR